MQPAALQIAPFVIRTVSCRRIVRAAATGITADLGALKESARGQVLHGRDRSLDLGDLPFGSGAGNGLWLRHRIDVLGKLAILLSPE